MSDFNPEYVKQLQAELFAANGQITSLQRENAELTTLAEARLISSREQSIVVVELRRIINEKSKVPFGYLHFPQGRVMPEFHYKQSSHEGMMKVYAAPPIQDGMVAVPVEPTFEMNKAGSRAWQSWSSDEYNAARNCYKAMIEASKEKI